MGKKINLNLISVRNIAFLILIIFTEIFYVRYVWVKTKTEQSNQVKQVALSVHAVISRMDLKQLTAKASDETTDSYLRIKEKLQFVIDANPKARFAYLYLLRNGKLLIMVDSEEKGAVDESLPGQEITEAISENYLPFITGEARISNPVTDRWGTWVSVQVPFIDSTTGNVTSVLGMDYDASDWQKVLLVKMIDSVGLALLSLLLIIALYFSHEKNKIMRTKLIEIKQAESKIIKLSRAIEQSPVSIIITDFEGRIEYTNPRFSKITQFDFDEVKSKNPRFLKSGQMEDEIYKKLWETITSGKTWKGEIINKKKNGNLYWEKKLVSPIVDSEGQITHFVGIGIDITEKKEKEAELIATKEKAEESDRLKSAFLANLSHEIRTPLNGILGFSELLCDPDFSQEKKEEFFTIVKSNTNRFLHIINDLIEISKIEVGEKTLQVRQTNINKILHELNLSFMPLGIAKNVQMNYHCDLSEKECEIVTDGIKLKQIMTNLLDNALKFTEKGSVNFGYIRKYPSIEFYVSDTGPGVSEEQKEAIFERFRQEDLSLTRKHQGAGLGLSISKAYVEMLGGSIWLESEPGKGSTFWFELPLKYSEIDKSKS